VASERVANGLVDTSFADLFVPWLDTGSLVNADFKSPNAFTGKIDKVTFDLKPIASGTRGEIEELVGQVTERL
jgi:hypothetical protein